MSEIKQDFMKRFEHIAGHRHRYEVWRDFVTMSAIALHNAVKPDNELEQEYLSIVAKYNKDEANELGVLLGNLVVLMGDEPRDTLGTLYMELELGNEKTGQFFTPPDLSHMMAQMLYGSQVQNLDKPFITLSEPACGAGGMVLAFAKVMRSYGHDPAHKLWVQCIDVDRLAALMCYLQLSLWHIPAEVVVGNTLSLEVRQVFYTPAHYLGCWNQRLLYRSVQSDIVELTQAKTSETEDSPALEADKPEVENAKEPAALKGSDIQFDFGF